jgi:hypothetical protein
VKEASFNAYSEEVYSAWAQIIEDKTALVNDTLYEAEARIA